MEKCPMKFNNPCADVNPVCDEKDCMWYMLVDDLWACAISHIAKSKPYQVVNTWCIPGEIEEDEFEYE